MSRDPGLYLQDIHEAAVKIETMLLGIDQAALSGDWRIRDVVLHNLEVIGEAVKRLAEPLKAEAPEVPWRRIASFRDILAHAYFSVDDAIVWDVAKHEVPAWAQSVQRLLKNLDAPPPAERSPSSEA
jgi:uncharacterized protein with HEPN domain